MPRIEENWRSTVCLDCGSEIYKDPGHAINHTFEDCIVALRERLERLEKLVENHIYLGGHYDG